MKRSKVYNVLIILISSIWLINGLLFKILNYVPRHQEIVSEIFGKNYSETLIVTIGLLEVLLALWIIVDYKPKVHATLQILTVLMMNIIEFILVPDLLFWGKLNIVFALAFVSLIHYTYFIYNKNYVRIS